MSKRKPNPYKRADSLTKAAKARGYPARSVFKLEEIDRRVRLFQHRYHVLDLGAAPGSWSMYAGQRVGGTGRVLAVDLSPTRVNLGSNVKAIEGDVFELDDTVLGELGPYDVVLSDMAPSTSGNKFSDQSRSFDLVMRAIEIARAMGKAKSSFVAKIFMGPDFDAARKALRETYEEVRVIRPESTRSISAEVFLIGLKKTA